jgi:CHASE1-domain containing sensor protein
LHFNRAAAGRISAVGRSIYAGIDVIDSLLVFFVAHGEAERASFDAFATSSLGRHKSIKALEWVPQVSATDRAAYEAAARRDGLLGFRITERQTQGQMVAAGEREYYFPVYFVAPYEGNEIALGFDLGSNASRLEAMETARDSGDLVASGRITLVQELGAQYGFLAFAPVYRSGSANDTTEHRRKNLLGFALGVYRLGDVVADAFSHGRANRLGHPAGIDLYLYDLSGKADARLLHVYSSRSRSDRAPMMDENQARSGPHAADLIDVAGQEWLIVARPTNPNFGGEAA